jgi:hypothetical protein
MIMDAIQIVVFSCLCLLLLLIAFILFRFSFYLPINKYMSGTFSLIFKLIIFIVLALLIIYYNPVKLQYDEEIKDAEKDYIKHSNYESYFSKQLKHVWQNAVADQFNYYVIIAVILLYIPFVVYIIYLLYVNEIPAPVVAVGPAIHWLDYFPPVHLINAIVLIITCIYVFIYGYDYKYLTIPITFGLGSFAYSFLTI